MFCQKQLSIPTFFFSCSTHIFDYHLLFQTFFLSCNGFVSKLSELPLITACMENSKKPPHNSFSLRHDMTAFILNQKAQLTLQTHQELQSIPHFFCENMYSIILQNANRNLFAKRDQFCPRLFLYRVRRKSFRSLRHPCKRIHFMLHGSHMHDDTGTQEVFSYVASPNVSTTYRENMTNSGIYRFLHISWGFSTQNCILLFNPLFCRRYGHHRHRKQIVFRVALREEI